MATIDYITEIIAVLTVITSISGAFYLTKKQSEDNTKAIALLFKKHDDTRDDINVLRDNQNKLLTVKDADRDYLRRKEFEIHLKNIDKQIANIESNTKQILEVISNKCVSCER